jgi:hypothetical protein
MMASAHGPNICKSNPERDRERDNTSPSPTEITLPALPENLSPRTAFMTDPSIKKNSKNSIQLEYWLYIVFTSTYSSREANEIFHHQRIGILY